jgi:hypothetical protein
LLTENLQNHNVFCIPRRVSVFSLRLQQSQRWQPPVTNRYPPPSLGVSAHALAAADSRAHACVQTLKTTSQRFHQPPLEEVAQGAPRGPHTQRMRVRDSRRPLSALLQ